MASPKRIGWGVLVVLAVLLVTIVAPGWLYVIRGAVAGWPGPRMRLALPLDELPRHDAVPIVVFLPFWVMTAGLLGLWLRVSGVRRTRAAVLLLLSVGVWEYLVDALLLFIVRGIGKKEALRASARVAAVYVPAALAAAAGAALGRSGGTARQ